MSTAYYGEINWIRKIEIVTMAYDRIDRQRRNALFLIRTLLRQSNDLTNA